MDGHETGAPASAEGVVRSIAPGDDRALHEALGTVMPTVLARYLSMAGMDVPEEPRAFAAHQAACRAALAHVNLLIRSIHTVAARGAGGSHGEPAQLIHEARLALGGPDDDTGHDADA